MKSFKQHLLEKRKNPGLNPKISAYMALKPYKNDPNIYITFTTINKVGINPHSSFNTPNGIYTYPLKEIWEYFNHYNHAVVVPYAGEAPYIWILQEKCTRFVDMSKYTNSDLKNDLKKIKKLYDDGKILKHTKANNFIGLEKELNKIIQMFIDDGRIKIKKLPSINFVGEFDDHFTIDMDKAEEIYTSSKMVNRWKSMMMTQVNGILKKMKPATSTKSAIDIIIDAVMLPENSTGKQPINKLWNLTRWIASGGNPDDNASIIKFLEVGKGVSYTANQTGQNWNNLLRELGYCGFADKAGRGFIHQNEPTQAVFLSKDGFKVIDKILNIQPKETLTSLKDMLKRDKDSITFLELNKRTKKYELNKNNLMSINNYSIPKEEVEKAPMAMLEIIVDRFPDLDDNLKRIVLENMHRYDDRYMDGFLEGIVSETAKSGQRIYAFIEQQFKKYKVTKNKIKSLNKMKKYLENNEIF